jgi:polysaccharide biosynthesis transport protein
MPSDVQPFSFWRQWLILRRRLRLIVFATFVCGLAAAVFSLLQPKIFEATTHLLVSESKLADLSSRNATYVYYDLLRSYETFINNDYLIQKTLEHFQLQKPPYELTPDGFKRRRILRVELAKNTRLLEVSVEFPEPKLAADIANYFASNAVAFNEEMNARDAQRTRESLKQQLDQALEAMERSRQTLLEFSKTSGLEELRESVWSLLEEKSQAESQLAQLNTDLSRVSARRQGLGEELQRQAPRIELKRSLAENPILKESLSAGSPEKSAPPATTLVKEESVNPVYQQVQSLLVETDVELLGLGAARQAVEKAAEARKQRLAVLLREKALKESTLDRLTQDYQLASDSYESLSKQYQDAWMNVSARSTDLKVIAPAIVPERPVSPRLPLNVVLAAALGLVLSSLLALWLHQFELSKAEMPLELENGGAERINEIKRSAKGRL